MKPLWSGFLKFSESLPLDEDICVRVAVSRAYYAAYHAANAWLIKKNIILSGRDKHKQLWKLIQDDSSKTVRSLSKLGNELKNAREAADYNSLELELEESPFEMIKKAKKIISALEPHI